MAGTSETFDKLGGSVDLRDEEDQVQAIKQWWDDNGTYVLGAVGLAVAGTFGWDFYQNQQADAALARSDAYQQVLVAANSQNPQQLLEAAGLVQQQHADTEYAKLATLFAAKALVETGDLEGAAAQLQGLTNTIAVTDPIGAEARLRLAAVQLSLGNHDQAQSLLGDGFTSAYEARALELRGDVLLAMGQRSEAKASYERALDAEGAAGLPLLRIKLDDLADA